MVNYAVVGAGAVGGYFGARLAHQGHQMQFVFRSDADVVRRDGLRVESPTGDFTIADPNVVSATADLDVADVVIVGVKGHANAEVAPQVAQIVKPGGAIILIQNGVGSESIYAEHVDSSVTVIGGLAFIASERVPPRTVAHHDYGMLTLADYAPDYSPVPPSPITRTVAEDFQSAGVPTDVSDDLLLSRYTKLLWNVPFNPLTVILNATTAVLMESAEATELIRSLMDEVRAVARADGRDIAPEIVDVLIQSTQVMKPYEPSMKVDYSHARPLEIDLILDGVLDRAAALGVATPRLATVRALASFLDRRNRGNIGSDG